MKEALVLETYDEIKNAMMSGKDINFEMVIDGKEEEAVAKENSQSNELKLGDTYYVDGKAIGVVIAINARVKGESKNLVLALNSPEKEMNWYEAMDFYKDNLDGWRLPTKEECHILGANLEEINSWLEKSGGESLDGWFWSSSEYNNLGAWFFCTDYGAVSGGLDYTSKGDYSNGVVRPVLAF